MTALPALTMLHWPLPHPPFPCHAGLVGRVILGLKPLAQCSIYKCCILGAANVHRSCVASAEICNANELARILHPLTCNTTLLNGAHITLLLCIHACWKFTTVRGRWHCLYYPLPLPCACCNVQHLPNAPCTQQKGQQGLGYATAAYKNMSALNMFGREWVSDTYLHCGSGFLSYSRRIETGQIKAGGCEQRG